MHYSCQEAGARTCNSLICCGARDRRQCLILGAKCSTVNLFVSVLPRRRKSPWELASLTTCVNQGTLKLRELKKENERLVHEVEKLKKIQETCMTILESRNINPGKEFALCLHPGTPPEWFFFSFCCDYS